MQTCTHAYARFITEKRQSCVLILVCSCSINWRRRNSPSRNVTRTRSALFMELQLPLLLVCVVHTNTRTRTRIHKHTHTHTHTHTLYRHASPYLRRSLSKPFLCVCIGIAETGFKHPDELKKQQQPRMHLCFNIHFFMLLCDDFMFALIICQLFKWQITT